MPKSRSFLLSVVYWELYRYEKKEFAIEFVDVGLRPDLVNRYNIIKSPAISLEYMGKTEKAKSLSELDVTNALISLSRPSDTTIYYTTNHGEVDLESTESDGGKHLAKMIERSSYQLKKSNLQSLSQIPSSVMALIIWGPKSGFFDKELKLIDQFLQKGGKLLVALDPSLKGDMFKGLRRYLQSWGLTISNNFVIDRLKHIDGSQGSVPIVHHFDKEHPITSELSPPIFFL